METTKTNQNKKAIDPKKQIKKTANKAKKEETKTPEAPKPDDWYSAPEEAFGDSCDCD